MAKEGRSMVFPFLVVALTTLILAIWFRLNVFYIIAGILGLLTVFLVYFFRDPNRLIPANDNFIVSPADGRILSVETVIEPDFLGESTQKISIFMSPLNVHINRIPMSGTVEFFRYYKGKFMAAYRPEAAAENEQTVIGITNGPIKLLFKQISGVLARRIVCNLKQGDAVTKGERFGMIKLGSRVDIYLPETVKLQVRNNQTVKGGASILGVIENGPEE